MNSAIIYGFIVLDSFDSGFRASIPHTHIPDFVYTVLCPRFGDYRMSSNYKPYLMPYLSAYRHVL